MQTDFPFVPPGSRTPAHPPQPSEHDPPVELLMGLLGDHSAATRRVLSQLLDRAGGSLQRMLLDERAITLATREVPGLTSKMLSLLAIERAMHLPAADRVRLDRPGPVARFVHSHYFVPNQEVMGALFLDRSDGLLHSLEIFRGALSAALVSPIPILREALLCSSASFLLFHTHPSGDPTPSAGDFEFTDRLERGARAIGVYLLDHLVVGDYGRWYSFAQGGVLGFRRYQEGKKGRG